MKKIFKRLIVFFTGVPVLLLVILFFPQKNHLLLNLVIVVFSVLSAVEFRNILSSKSPVISLAETIILGAVCPAAWTLVISFGIGRYIVPISLITGASWLIMSRIFAGQEKLDSYIGYTTSGLAIMIYPGLFLAWIIRMATFREAGFVILFFFLITFFNDAAAWAAGVLFGNNNRGIVKASPNKSIAGFIGGQVGSVVIGIAAVIFFPDAFSSGTMNSIFAGSLLGFGTGIAAIIGDLGESAIKRSGGVKDSGSLILGRGGALDSIDSLILAAPLYYFLYRILF